MMTNPTVLFDLDGTLLDTAPDLSLALNNLRKARDLPPINLDILRPLSGAGARHLLHCGFNLSEADENYHAMVEEFIQAYANCLTENTTFFDGIRDLLKQLKKQSITWGIVTNKPESLALPLINAMSFPSKPSCIVCGDTLPQRKPHPAPLLYAAKILSQPPENCIYIGDSEYDIIAATAAGMKVITALYGYIPLDETPHNWQYDLCVDSAHELYQSIQTLTETIADENTTR